MADYWSIKVKKIRLIGFWLISILLIAIIPTAVAQEIPENFTPIRPLGMGGAFTGLANDENAIWTNPAGVSRVRKARSRKSMAHTSFPNIGLGANASARGIYQAQSGNKEEELSDIVADSEDLGDSKPYWAMVSVFPIALINYQRDAPGAIGFFSHTVTKMLIEESNPDQTKVETVSDAGGVLNFTWTNRTNRFTTGIQVRYTARYAYEDIVQTDLIKDELVDRMKTESNQSVGVGVDYGTIYTVADYWFPTIGFSILNIPLGCKKDYLNPYSKTRQQVCGTVYTGNIENEDALSTVDPTDFRVGISITPRLTRKIGLRIAGDLHHVHLNSGEMHYGLSDIETKKTIHGGVELFWGNPLLTSPFSLRMGYGQGFMSTGFSVRLGVLALDFASYGRDVGSEATAIEDRRYLGGLSLVF